MARSRSTHSFFCSADKRDVLSNIINKEYLNSNAYDLSWTLGETSENQHENVSLSSSLDVSNNFIEDINLQDPETSRDIYFLILTLLCKYESNYGIHSFLELESFWLRWNS